MEKIYKNENVYDAFCRRMKYVFCEFDNIYVSFSGGKDSGLLYHLVIKYMADHGIKRRIGLFHQDFEAQYKDTTAFVTRTFDSAPDYVDKFWCCLPLGARNATSSFAPYWFPWDPDKRDIWVRPMPDRPEVINLDNNPLGYYQYKMLESDFSHHFGPWYRDCCGGGKTVALLGIRTSESLRRYSGIVNKRHAYKGEKWITSEFKDTYTASPLYDWETEDVWTANGKFGFDYNHLYDLFYKAGVPLSAMRVASPYIEFGTKNLSLYRVIEPETWVKIVGRVEGANFGAIYGSTKAMGYKEITLPPGHTWKSYLEFLLKTLPPNIRDHYIEKFNFSKKFWAETGGGLAPEAIKEIQEKGYKIRRNGPSPYCKGGKERVVFDGEIPDNTDDVTSTIDIPSYKRCCFCILKNDYLCRFMGFGPTKDQKEHIKAIKNKYAGIIKYHKRSDLDVQKPRIQYTPCAGG